MTNKEGKLIEKIYEAIGWAYADCCVALDERKDPRKKNMADVIDRAIKDLEIPNKINKREGQ